MNIRHLTFAKSIPSSLFNYIIKKNVVTFAAFLLLSSVIILSLLFNGNFAVQAHNSENETSESGSILFANLSLVIRIGQDGLAPLNTTADRLNDRKICPSNPTAGCDFGYHNAIVRTNDQVVYTYDYAVNGGDDDITVIASAPYPGTAWDFLPAFCYAANEPQLGDPPSTITGDGITSPSVITCRRRMKATGTAESLPFTATVLGDRLNGDVLNASGAVTGPNSSMVFGGAPNVTVSAAPRFNLRKSYAGRSSLTTVDSVSGYILFYVADIEVRDTDSEPPELNPRYGSSVLSSPITFTDDVSGVSPPNAKLIDCSILNHYGGTAGTSPPNCTQAATGQTIFVTITGADTSLKQYSSPPGSNRFSIGAYLIRVFIPAADVPAYPGSLSTINKLRNFNPTSPPSPTDLSGLINFGTDSLNPFENLDDNDTGASISHNPPSIPGDGFFRKQFLRDDNATLSTDTLVAPGGNIKAQVSFTNDSNNPMNNVVLCDVIDNTKYNVFGTSAADIIEPSGANVQFATGYVNSNWLPTAPGNLNEIRNECNIPETDWKPITDFLPGNLGQITKFRITYASVSANDSVSARVRMQVRDTYNNQLIPAGTPLVNLGAWRHDGVGNYIENDFARLILARATVRITKETENNNTANSIETANGNGIGFVLKPTISSILIAGPGIPAQQVTVVDVLPVGLIFNGIANPMPTVHHICTAADPNLLCSAVGQHILSWTLIPNYTPGTPIPPITFRVTADLSVFNNEVLTNTAIVSSPADPSHVSLRTATRNIIGASPSTFLIYKQTDTPQIDVNGLFSYKVTYTNRSFITDFSGMDFIDVLPSNTDGTLPFGSGTHIRTPPTSYNPGGSRTLASVSVTGGTPVWYFTRANIASINISPKHSSNLNPEAPGNIWCAGTAAGPDFPVLTDSPNCENFTLSQVTAVRMRDTTLMLRDNTIRSFTLNFTSNNNQAGDIYTNNSSGAVTEIVLPVSSINVPVIVVSGSISGTVWYDTDGNGIRNALETGKVNNSLVTLMGTTNGNTPVNRTMNTDTSGNYLFDGLSSGTYTVKFTRPLNYRASSRGSDSDGDPVTLITDSLSVGATTIDQGFYQLNLGGTVWHDSDRNGKLLLENPIPNIDVQLLSNGIPLQKDQTAADGTYSFVNLEAGDYQVVIDPNGIIASPVFFPNPNDNMDSDNNGMPQTGLIISNPITLAAGTEPTINNANGKTHNNTLDFGLVLSPTAASVALGGRIAASDGRGVFKAIVTMTDANGSVHTAITNPFGYYRFDDVPVGTTVIISVSSKNYTFEVSTRVISVTDELTDINFVSNN
jgi:uncharacterized repeat protein (TIGR01451 family)